MMSREKMIEEIVKLMKEILENATYKQIIDVYIQAKGCVELLKIKKEETND